MRTLSLVAIDVARVSLASILIRLRWSDVFIHSVCVCVCESMVRAVFFPYGSLLLSSFPSNEQW